jgi:hypothetical protein
MVLSVDSVPGGFKIFASYYTSNSRHFLTSDAPFNLRVDPNTPVCVLPANTTGGDILNWTVDEEECQFSTCEVTSYNRTGTIYSDNGCLINMNADHSVTFYYTPA